MKKIEAIFSMFGICGAITLSCKLYFGWLLFFASSLIGIYFFYTKKLYWSMLLQFCFSITNIIGIYNYILYPTS